MHWYIVHTKPRQEKLALDNLSRQGYICYLPLLQAEKLTRGHVSITVEPLFPRYLFVQTGPVGCASSLTPVRYTKGVNRLVSFGLEPAKIDNSLVEMLRRREIDQMDQPRKIFSPGDRVQLAGIPFAGVEGIYQMAEGEQRVMVLIELLSRPVSVVVPQWSLRKVG